MSTTHQHRHQRLTASAAIVGLLLATLASTAVSEPAAAQPQAPEPPDAAAIAAEEAGLDHPAPEGVTADAADAPAEPAGVIRAADGVPTGRWVVQLDEPALASYEGGIEGLPPTSPTVTGADQLDVDAPASVAYRDHLEDEQAQLLRRIERALGRSVTVDFQYLNVLNGLAMELDLAEAETVAELAGVAAVFEDVEHEIDTDVTHALIGTPSLWDGETGPQLPTRGEGIVVGMLDTGVNVDHPSFAAVDGEGHVHENPFGDGTYVGVCDPDHPDHQDVCNSKLIGAWNFHPTGPTRPSVEDWNDHGSHVGSTIAGNVHDATFRVGADEHTRTIQGVAPRANVISYLVCDPGCPQSASVAAVNQAIEDGVDVLNYSISGGDNPWVNMVDLAFLDAFNAGMFVAASAGNDGPGAGTVAKTGPWNASVAATTHGRVIAHTMDVIAEDPIPPALEGMAAVPSPGPQITEDLEAPIRYAGLVAPGNTQGCVAFPDGAFDDVIALIQRGDCTFQVKVGNAAAAGASAVVVFNHVAGPPIAMGFDDDPTVPSVFIDATDGAALRDAIVDAPNATQVRIDAPTHLLFDEAWEDVVAGFSSRGPSQFDLLAPTFAAPGVNVLAAGAAAEGDPTQYATMQGTSMSSPVGAGAAALLMALHPDWSPAQVRSALAMTAEPDGLVKEDGVSPADPLDVGSGRLDLERAGRVGLVLDATHDEFVAANPATGGDPRTLNLPALVDQACLATCSWTRTLTHVAEGDASYTAVTGAPAGVSLTVDPAGFTLSPGETQHVTVTLDVSEAPLGAWVFGEVRFETDDQHGPDGPPIATARLPVGAVPPPPELTVEPAELASTQESGEVVETVLTIGNDGAGLLEWALTELAPLGSAATRAEEHGTTRSVLWEQQVSGTSGIISDHSTVLDAGVYAADDFTLPTDARLEVIHADGFWNQGSLAEAVAINWFLYPDDDGRPAGEPTDGQDRHVWTHRTAPTGEGVDIGGDDITLDVVVATGDAIELTAGTYWLSVFPDIESPDLAPATRWNWAQANQRGAEARLIDPADLFGAEFTSWTPLSDVGLDWGGLAFRIEGSLDCTPGEIPWLDASPTSGSVAPGDDVEVAVTFDSSGLSAGTHEAALCLQSNDPVRSQLVVPVTLDVIEIPRIEVVPDHLDADAFFGQVVERTLAVRNVGDGVLTWEVEDSERLSLLSDGVLLVPDSSNNRVMAFDPETGDLIDADFIPEDEAANLGTPQHVIPSADGSMLLLSDQLRSEVYAYDLDGNWLGVFAPAGGADFSVVRNIRGIDMTDDGRLLATSAVGDNAHAIPAFDGDGGFVGNFIDNEAGGMRGPWFIVQRDEDVLVSSSTSSAIHRFTPDGDPLDVFHGPIAFPQQMQELEDGNVLVANFSAPSGVWELTADGELIDVYTGVSGNRGVYELPNGNLLTTNNAGVHEIDRGSVLVETKLAGVAARKISHVRLDTPCEAISEVDWLHVSPASGTTVAGDATELTVTFDATDLAPGQHTTAICLRSDDPDQPRVVVPVSFAVGVYDQLVNAGSTSAYEDGDGNVWDADRVHTDGEWGYTRRQAPRQRTSQPIAGTADDELYQFARQHPLEYRFDALPDGVYDVELRFAEIGMQRPGNRVFDVRVGDEVVLADHDIAASAGLFHADDHLVEVAVSDGQLRIAFDSDSGPPPIVNAIRVTQRAGG